MRLQCGRQGERVIVRVDGGLGHLLHWQAADELVKALRSSKDNPTRIRFGATAYDIPLSMCRPFARKLKRKVALAEHWAERERIADDGALLCRVGYPVGITDNPAIQNEIRKRAAWDKDLRRYLPGGVKSEEVIGCATIWRSFERIRRQANVGRNQRAG